MRILSFSVLLLLTTVGAPAQEPTGLAPSTVTRIEAAVSNFMTKTGVPGVSVAVVTENQLRWSNGYGLADLENFVPATSDTMYRLASISKTITATAVMQLVEQGKLDLDAPVQNYCPAFPQKQWLVTSRELLAHQGGIRHYKPGETGMTTHYASVAAGLAVFKDDPLAYEPGTQYLYSSYGFNLLGCAVEGASGERYEDYVAKHVFKPAGMERIQIDSAFKIIPHRSQGYRRTADGGVENSAMLDTSYKIPSGGFISTASDLARLAIAVETGKLLKDSTLQQMFKAGSTRDGKVTAYGLGWELGQRNGWKEVYHTGAQERVSTILYMLPEKKFAAAAMCNLQAARCSELARSIADVLLLPPK